MFKIVRSSECRRIIQHVETKTYWQFSYPNARTAYAMADRLEHQFTANPELVACYIRDAQLVNAPFKIQIPSERHVEWVTYLP